MNKKKNINAGFKETKALLSKLLSDTPTDSKISNKYHVHRPSQRIEDSIEQQKQKLENEGLAQDIKLKRYTLNALFIFLAIETIIVFIFSFLQATNIIGFYLEDWSFRLLFFVTISQITLMLNVAVKHLFPQK